MKADQQQVQALLTDTVTLLCKNGLHYRRELKVQGLLGITVDDNEVFVVHINKLYADACSNGRRQTSADAPSDSDSEEQIQVKNGFLGSDSAVKSYDVSHVSCAPKKTQPVARKRTGAALKKAREKLKIKLSVPKKVLKAETETCDMGQEIKAEPEGEGEDYSMEDIVGSHDMEALPEDFHIESPNADETEYSNQNYGDVVFPGQDMLQESMSLHQPDSLLKSETGGVFTCINESSMPNITVLNTTGYESPQNSPDNDKEDNGDNDVVECYEGNDTEPEDATGHFNNHDIEGMEDDDLEITEWSTEEKCNLGLLDESTIAKAGSRSTSRKSRNPKRCPTVKKDSGSTPRSNDISYSSGGENLNELIVTKYYDYLQQQAAAGGGFQCVSCDLLLKTRKGWLEHMKGAHMNRRYPCSICGDIFKWRSSRQRHMISCSGRPSKLDPTIDLDDSMKPDPDDGESTSADDIAG